MKKTLAILVLALFIGGISAPVIAANSNALTLISLNEEDPKKKEAKTEDSKKATTKSDCSSEKKSDCSSEKKSDCSKK